MESIDVKSIKFQIMVWFFLFIFIFSLARFMKSLVYDATTDSTIVISLDDQYMVISGSKITNTEESGHIINNHNKNNLDEIESTTKEDNEESISQ